MVLIVQQHVGYGLYWSFRKRFIMTIPYNDLVGGCAVNSFNHLEMVNRLFELPGIPFHSTFPSSQRSIKPLGYLRFLWCLL